ncbi:MAG: prolipoprotein diacylglyceryl transferase [Pseudomonadota bacterium]
MVLAIAFPEFDPVAFTIPLLGLPIRWYALAYIVGLVIGWRYIARLAATDRLWPGGRRPFDPIQVDDLLFYCTLGVVIGGRLGFVLFYEPSLLWTLSQDTVFGLPLPRAVEIWKGGMSFHGGFLGVAVAAILFARRTDAPLLSVGDCLACAAPFGIFFGRIANFVNGELWGRTTEAPWGVVFPQVQLYAVNQGVEALLLPGGVNLPRHPSQLYEAALEGVLLSAVLLWLVWRAGALRRPGLAIGVFLAGYGIGRFIAEFWRMPDLWIGDGEFDLTVFEIGFTRGQFLSLPMIVIGALVIYTVLRRPLEPDPPDRPARGEA